MLVAAADFSADNIDAANTVVYGGWVMQTKTDRASATARLLTCVSSLQDPSVTDHNGERRVTFNIGDHYSAFPQTVVNQSGGVYTTTRQLRDDLRAVGGSITVGHYRFGLGSDRSHREGADILIDDLTVSTAVAPADFDVARAAHLAAQAA